MRNIKVEKTKITEEQIKFRGDSKKTLDYKDLIEVALDVVPQGGFAPKDIRDRNRIQDILDKSNDVYFKIEDADYDNLVKVMADSRWIVRSPELDTLLQNFEDGVYKVIEEEKKSGKK